MTVAVRTPLHGSAGPVDTPTKTYDVQAEAIRALRTHVMAQHVQEGRRALAVCAPSEGSGCTFVSVNLAVSLAQIGVKTLLIDGDLRDPGVDALLEPASSRPGLKQYLSSPGVEPGEAIVSDRLPDLSVMYAGGPAADALELLSGDRFQSLMNYCLRDYEVTIVDTPPANTCADARRISTVVGYSLIVARRNHSFIEDLQILTRQLRSDHARVIGTVLNEA